MEPKYTVTRKRRKADARPAKPYSDFPLYAHPLGYWSKKIKQKIIHFGREICQEVVFRGVNQAAASVCLIPSMNKIP